MGALGNHPLMRPNNNEAQPSNYLDFSESQELKILVAEDNKINQKVVKGMFKKLGLMIEIVPDGAKALEAATSGQKFDLLFMDCQMPGMDGYEATTKIREYELKHGGHLPIIAMTANAMEGDKQRCLDTGMDDYIAKPLKLDTLGAMLSRWHNKIMDQQPQ